MARVQRANVILTVEDHEVSHFLAQGYNVIDASGAILNEAIPTNVGVLQAKFLEHTRKIAELEGIIAQYKAEAAAKTRKKKDAE